MRESIFDYPRSYKIGASLTGMFLLGFGWHIRGSGTSDPTVLTALFLLFVAAIFPNQKKMNFVLFGIITVLMRLGRRGWGTFVAQAGIPGLYPGFLSSYVEGYSITVEWWQGFFWLFITGIAWGGLPSILLGGYILSSKKYNWKNLLFHILIYYGGYIIGCELAKLLIPFISPDAYQIVYLEFGSERNFGTMVDNFGYTFGILSVLIVIYVQKRDLNFIKRMLFVLFAFGLAFSVTDLWQVFGRNIPELNIPAWSLWEYSTGFILGGMLMSMFLMHPKEIWIAADENHLIPVADNTSASRFLNYFFGHVALFLYGMGESIAGLINPILENFGYKSLPGTLFFVILLIIDLPVYLLYQKGKFGTKFRDLPFQQKSMYLCVGYSIFAYAAYMCQFIVNGTLFAFERANILQFLNTISIIILIIFFIGYKNKKVLSNDLVALVVQEDQSK